MHPTGLILSMATLLAAFCTGLQASQERSPGSEVRVVSQADGSFTLLRNGEPYQVKGAGIGTGDHAVLKASGGNSVRTWGIEQLERQQLFDQQRIERLHIEKISFADSKADEQLNGLRQADEVLSAALQAQQNEWEDLEDKISRLQTLL